MVSADYTEDHANHNPIAMLRPRRKIVGMSAILLPFDDRGQIDWDGFRAHVARTFAAGLVPAVNMDTGYVNLIAPEERRLVLDETRRIANGREYVAGAFVRDELVRRSTWMHTGGPSMKLARVWEFR